MGTLTTFSTRAHEHPNDKPHLLRRDATTFHDLVRNEQMMKVNDHLNDTSLYSHEVTYLCPEIFSWVLNFSDTQIASHCFCCHYLISSRNKLVLIDAQIALLPQVWKCLSKMKRM